MGTEPNPRTLRALRPADLPQVARVHGAAFPTSSLSRLGEVVLQRYYRWQLVEGPHDVTAIGVFELDRLVGFVIGGTFRGAMSGFVHANRGLLVRRLVARPWVAMSPKRQRHLRSAWRLARKGPPPAGGIRRTAAHFGILVIAVEPEAQGRGAGRMLLEAAERAAMEAGFQAMRLTVRKSNREAMAFYERLGWKKEASSDDRSEQLTKQLRPSP